MKFGVVVFPGTNAADGITYILEKVMHQQVHQLWHKTAELGSFSTNDCLIIPTGSAFGNYLRPGALTRFSPVMEKIKAFAAKGGYVLGIGNGFQILCEAGLLPGALLPNQKGLFIAKNVKNYSILLIKMEVAVSHLMNFSLDSG